MNQDQWERKARKHERCCQTYLVLHHALLVPSILVPPVVSLFNEGHASVKYTVVAASLTTALSLGLKLELRAHIHARVARDYTQLAFDARNGDDVRTRAAQLLREAPMLPGCVCGRNGDPTRHQGETGAG